MSHKARPLQVIDFRWSSEEGVSLCGISGSLCFPRPFPSFPIIFINNTCTAVSKDKLVPPCAERVKSRN